VQARLKAVVLLLLLPAQLLHLPCCVCQSCLDSIQLSLQHARFNSHHINTPSQALRQLCPPNLIIGCFAANTRELVPVRPLGKQVKHMPCVAARTILTLQRHRLTCGLGPVSPSASRVHTTSKQQSPSTLLLASPGDPRLGPVLLLRGRL
jgi:hypothetical protein